MQKRKLHVWFLLGVLGDLGWQLVQAEPSNGCAHRHIETVWSLIYNVRRRIYPLEGYWLERVKRLGEPHPAQFMTEAEDDDIASVATFLASNDSKWITGELVRAGGGLR